jgi:lipoprotein-releasing system ATP-binding protein
MVKHINTFSVASRANSRAKYEPTENGLSVVDLRKGFIAPDGNRIEVLRGLSLTVAPGESVAIMGASGSGKSTLLQLLGGLDEPDHGSITLACEEVAQLKGSASSSFRQTRIGFVFQFHYLLGDLSAIENVALPLLIQRKGKREAFSRARVLLDELGLAERIDHPIGHLSGGEQQRVAVARALITNPELILADEPTGNLDLSISTEIAKTLTNYSSAHERMAIIATHNRDLARMCDRVLVLKDGRLHDN